MTTTTANRSPLIVQPHLYMGDVTGKPLDYGMVYFGEPNKDPEFYPINIYYDKDLTQQASQPVRTKGGFLNANGDMVEIFALEGTYSVKVLDQYGRKVFYKGDVMKRTLADISNENIDVLQAAINDRISKLDASVNEDMAVLDAAVNDVETKADTSIVEINNTVGIAKSNVNNTANSAISSINTTKDSATTTINNTAASSQNLLDSKVNELNNATDAAKAAAAGANGWTADLIVYDGKTQTAFNNGIKGLERIADLLAIATPKDKQRVYVKSYHAGLKKGGGWFVFDSASTETANGGTVLVANDGTAGRWLRENNGDLVNPYMFGAYDEQSGRKDSSTSLQSFFDYIAVNNCGTANASGNFYISQGLELNGAKRPIAGIQEIATMNIIGNLTINALNGIDVMLKLYNCSNLSWNGRIRVYGTGSVAYSERTCRIGVHVSRSTRSRWGGFFCENFNSFGLDINDQIGIMSQADFGEVICSMCGSGGGASGSGLVANYSNRVDYTSTESPSTNHSTLNVDVLPPVANVSGWYRDQFFARINGVTYNVKNVDRTNSTVEIYPPIAENADLTGQLIYVFGGGVQLRGSDAAVIGFSMVDVMNCAIGIDMSTLYGPSIQRMISQSNGIGYVVGLYFDSAMVTYNISALYSEGNFVDIYHYTQAASDGGYFVGAEYALDFAKVLGNQNLFAIVKNGKYLNREKRANNFESRDKFARISVDTANQIKTYKADSFNAVISPPSIDINRLFGYDSATFIIVGTGATGTPTGNVTVSTSQSGWTLNGSTSATVFNNFSGGPAIFSVFCDMETKNIVVTCSSEIVRKNTTAVSAQTVAANSKYTQTVTVTGVELGDSVDIGYTQSLNGLILNAYVSATGTVVCEFINPTATPISLTAGSLKIKVTKF